MRIGRREGESEKDRQTDRETGGKKRTKVLVVHCRASTRLKAQLRKGTEMVESEADMNLSNLAA
jgi:dephospho-CoA kinase